MVSRIYKNRALKSQIERIASGVQKGESLNQKIIFCPLNGSSVNTIRESLLALACKQRGADVGMLYLDNHLTQSEFYKGSLEWLAHKKKVRSHLKFCLKIAVRGYKTTDYPDNIERKEPPTDIESIHEFEHRGVVIGDLAVASTVRSYLSNGPEWDNPDFMEDLENSFATAVRLVDIYSEFIDREKPDKLVMSHGIYISWGTLFRVARKKGIDVVCYGSSYRKNSLRFYHNTPNAPFPIADWPSFEGVDLSPSENALLNAYIGGRETQKDDNISLFDEETSIPEKLRTFMFENKEKKIFCLFSNIAWDAFAFGGHRGFPTMMDWIKETIVWFNEHSEAALIVKAHPAENYHKTPEKYRVRTLVNQLKLESNIILVGENDNVKPFWLYDKIDVGLIHISTVAIEMALENIPVLTSGAEGHYSGKGFTIDPSDKEEYFKLLEELAAYNNSFKPDIQAARKYMFYRFFREAIDFNLIELESLSSISKIHVSSALDLEIGKNLNLDIICDGILKNKKFVASYE